ncbi:hypothetical protein FA95DRAFT_1572781 [Auriscalpium vulgare]|uniref:Uncharacterized protein n=1 Tax=Auriscalpium vulgare TaxID=40419 RepID=A0ACB8RTY4_9AGAM|nr:hypothetical protein FA95DRAFT_1572781 [Auriscalpium vulgare]
MTLCRSIASCASTADVVERQLPRLPTELVYEILTRALGNYLSDILLAPDTIDGWDAIETLLRISQCFRCCMIKLMQFLWGGAFVEHTGVPTNHKPVISVLQQLAKLAHSTPIRLVQSPKARLLSHHMISTPRVPIVRMSKCYLLHVARVKACVAHKGLGLPAEIKETDCGDMGEFLDDYEKFPPQVRGLLFGPIEDSITEGMVLWKRIHTLRCLMETVCRLRFFIDPARFEQDDFLPHALILAKDELRIASSCTATAATILRRLRRPPALLDTQDVLPHDGVVRVQFRDLMSGLGELEKHGGARAVVCRTWRAALGRLLSERERTRWECACACAELCPDSARLEAVSQGEVVA